MIDSLGGPDRVNNFLSILNMKPISNPNPKKIERRAGGFVEEIAKISTENAAKEAFQREMEDIATEESASILESNVVPGDDYLDDLGTWALTDASPSVNTASSSSQHAATSHKHRSKSSTFTPVNFKPAKRKHRQRSSKGETSPNKTRKRLLGQFPCQKRKGMTCSADTAWHKRSFDSLTSHTFFMSKREYGKKVVKAIVLHRTCAVCKWWKRKRPGITLEENVDIEHIPEAVPKGQFKKLDPNGRQLTNITFDLETTGLIRGQTMPQITQIAAHVVDTGEVYNSYILPTIPIEEEASKVTGISINSNGELIANENKKDTFSIADGLQNFCEFLEKYQNPILIAHNGRRFDFPVIVNAAKKVNKLDQLLSSTFGCIDSIGVFRKAFP
ncbi:uncharacterized protein [Argopecten irradians]|uniref:uncharacterized protein n=1 Tax=Argopecten irradians TaxID=31199 RepID=UPI003711FF30